MWLKIVSIAFLVIKRHRSVDSSVGRNLPHSLVVICFQGFYDELRYWDLKIWFKSMVYVFIVLRGLSRDRALRLAGCGRWGCRLVDFSDGFQSASYWKRFNIVGGARSATRLLSLVAIGDEVSRYLKRQFERNLSSQEMGCWILGISKNSPFWYNKLSHPALELIILNDTVWIFWSRKSPSKAGRKRSANTAQYINRLGIVQGIIKPD